jgi:hypothetical protein
VERRAMGVMRRRVRLRATESETDPGRKRKDPPTQNSRPPKRKRAMAGRPLQSKKATKAAMGTMGRMARTAKMAREAKTVVTARTVVMARTVVTARTAKCFSRKRC